MTEREKVKAGLECLTHVNFAIYKTECQERNCPYKDAELDDHGPNDEDPCEWHGDGTRAEDEDWEDE